eukprot:5297582-Pyramimonas_sp.AAC.1
MLGSPRIGKEQKYTGTRSRRFPGRSGELWEAGGRNDTPENMGEYWGYWDPGICVCSFVCPWAPSHHATS